MKYLKFTILLVFINLSVFSQDDENPILWSHTSEKISGTEYELKITAKIHDEWHLYSQHTADGGSLPTEFTYNKLNEDYELIGKTTESETETVFSDVFEVDETFFKEKAIFTQKIRILKPDVKQIDFGIFYQVCKEVCLTQERNFVFSLTGVEVSVAKKKIDERSLALSAALKLDLKNKAYLEKDETLVKETSSLWMIFGLGFIGGLIALLTPCVFPMIPLTVSFFTKSSQKKSEGIKNALLYGFFIVLIYFLLSLPFHLFDSVDSQILNSIATNIWLNLLFFVIFMFFAFSFFGYYELTLPSSWANKMDAASSKAGGALGIFFMAITLAIVSFSCTGPILGGLLGSTTLAIGDVATNLSAGMTGFGVALGLPFALFALFPAWLNSLPKSGGWMTTVKVVLGFLEIGLALKFLSNADLVGHWGILKREIFIGIWLILALLMMLYLFGVFRFPHDDSRQKISVARKGVGVLTLAFAIYLSLGLTKISNLKLLSGFPPPDFYSIFEKETDCPLGLDCYKDFDEGLVEAKKQNKPILLDFTGWACVNCRKMEENVWSDPKVYNQLKENFILISLYTDDRQELTKEQQFNFQFNSGRIKTIETIAHKWGTFQEANFNKVSQPFYVLLSPDLEILNTPMQNTDVDTYFKWLSTGVSNFNKKSKDLGYSESNSLE